MTPVVDWMWVLGAMPRKNWQDIVVVEVVSLIIVVCYIDNACHSTMTSDGMQPIAIARIEAHPKHRPRTLYSFKQDSILRTAQHELCNFAFLFWTMFRCIFNSKFAGIK